MRLTSTTWKTLTELVPRPFARWTLLLGVGVIAGLLSAGHYWLFMRVPAGEAALGMLIVKLLVWLLWLPFVIIILEIAHRFPLESPHVARRLGALLLAMSVVLSLYLAGYASLLYLNAREPVSLLYSARVVMVNHSTYFVLAFWAIVLVENALRQARRSEQRSRQARELALQLERARLQSLHAQVRPHFLFNTLNSVSSLVLRGDQERANDVVVSLADLLRTSMQRKDEGTVTVREELAFVDQYLMIVRQRFADRLQVSREIASDTLELCLPSFVLQNLVENVIKHAVEKSEQMVCLTLKSNAEYDRLHLAVINTLPDDVPRAAAGEGYGLTSIRQRLQAQYGEAFVFDVNRSAPGSYQVHIALPIESATGNRRHE